MKNNKPTFDLKQRINTALSLSAPAVKMQGGVNSIPTFQNSGGVKIEYPKTTSGKLRNIEKQINKDLGKPMLKAFKNSTLNYDVGMVDNVRHTLGGMYTSQAIQDKFPDFVKVTGLPQAFGVLGANVLGLSHEVMTLLKDQRPWLEKGIESSEDMLNNFIGSLVSVIPLMSEKDKKDVVWKLSMNNLLPDGIYEGIGGDDVYINEDEKKSLNKSLYSKNPQVKTFEGGMLPDVIITAPRKKQGGTIQEGGTVNRLQQMMGYKDNSPYKNLPYQDIYSDRITMQGVSRPLIAKTDTGVTTVMQPGEEYYFPGASRVREIPMYKNGGGLKDRENFQQMKQNTYINPLTRQLGKSIRKFQNSGNTSTGTSTEDDAWIRKILEFETTQGNATGGGLSNWGYNDWEKFGHSKPPKDINEAIEYFKKDFLPKVAGYPIEIRKRLADYAYNSGRSIEDLLLFAAGKITLDDINSANVFTDEWNKYKEEIQKSLNDSAFIQKLDSARHDVAKTTPSIKKDKNGNTIYDAKGKPVRQKHTLQDPNPAYEATWSDRINLWGTPSQTTSSTSAAKDTANPSKKENKVVEWDKNGTAKGNFVLSNEAEIGSTIKLKDPNTGQTIEAKVVGRIPEGVYDKNTKIVMSPDLGKTLKLDTRGANGTAVTRINLETEYTPIPTPSQPAAEGNRAQVKELFREVLDEDTVRLVRGADGKAFIEYQGMFIPYIKGDNSSADYKGDYFTSADTDQQILDQLQKEIESSGKDTATFLADGFDKKVGRFDRFNTGNPTSGVILEDDFYSGNYDLSKKFKMEGSESQAATNAGPTGPAAPDQTASANNNSRSKLTEEQKKELDEISQIAEKGTKSEEVRMAPTMIRVEGSDKVDNAPPASSANLSAASISSAADDSQYIDITPIEGDTSYEYRYNKKTDRYETKRKESPNWIVLDDSTEKLRKAKREIEKRYWEQVQKVKEEIAKSSSAPAGTTGAGAGTGATGTNAGTGAGAGTTATGTTTKPKTWQEDVASREWKEPIEVDSTYKGSGFFRPDRMYVLPEEGPKDAWWNRPGQSQPSRPQSVNIPTTQSTMPNVGGQGGTSGATDKRDPVNIPTLPTSPLKPINPSQSSSASIPTPTVKDNAVRIGNVDFSKANASDNNSSDFQGWYGAGNKTFYQTEDGTIKIVTDGRGRFYLENENQLFEVDPPDSTDIKGSIKGERYYDEEQKDFVEKPNSYDDYWRSQLAYIKKDQKKGIPAKEFYGKKRADDYGSWNYKKGSFVQGGEVQEFSVGGGIAKGASTGATLGAALGTIVPGIGNVIGGAAGALIGGIAGGISGGIKQSKDKKEARRLQNNAIAAQNRASGNSSLLDLLKGNNSFSSLLMGPQNLGYPSYGQQMQGMQYNPGIQGMPMSPYMTNLMPPPFQEGAQVQQPQPSIYTNETAPTAYKTGLNQSSLEGAAYKPTELKMEYLPTPGTRNNQEQQGAKIITIYDKTTNQPRRIYVDSTGKMLGYADSQEDMYSETINKQQSNHQDLYQLAQQWKEKNQPVAQQQQGGPIITSMLYRNMDRNNSIKNNISVNKTKLQNVINLSNKVNPYRLQPGGVYKNGGMIMEGGVSASRAGFSRQPITGASSTGPLGPKRTETPDYTNKGVRSLMDLPSNEYVPTDNLIPIQTEIGEMIVLPTGDLMPVMARKRHHQMQDDEVTDVTPENSYILSAHGQVRINRNEADLLITETGVKPYRIGQAQNPPTEKTLGSIMTKSIMKPAEVAKRINSLFPVLSSSNPFEIAANVENKINRKPYLEGLIQLSELDKYRKGLSEPAMSDMQQQQMQMQGQGSPMLARQGGRTISRPGIVRAQGGYYTGDPTAPGQTLDLGNYGQNNPTYWNPVGSSTPPITGATSGIPTVVVPATDPYQVSALQTDPTGTLQTRTAPGGGAGGGSNASGALSGILAPANFAARMIGAQAIRNAEKRGITRERDIYGRSFNKMGSLMGLGTGLEAAMLGAQDPFVKYTETPDTYIRTMRTQTPSQLLEAQASSAYSNLPDYSQMGAAGLGAQNAAYAQGLAASSRFLGEAAERDRANFNRQQELLQANMAQNVAGRLAAQRATDAAVNKMLSGYGNLANRYTQGLVDLTGQRMGADLGLSRAEQASKVGLYGNRLNAFTTLTGDIAAGGEGLLKFYGLGK